MRQGQQGMNVHW